MDELKAKWTGLHMSHPNIMGRIYALLNAATVAVMAITVKFISSKTHFMVINGIQTTISALTAFSIFGYYGGNTMYHPDKEISLKLMFRGLIGSSFYLVYNYGIRYLPPQKFIVLANTQPIFVVIMAIFVLKEYPNLRLAGLLLMGLLGIVIMVDPGLILPNSWVYPDGIDNRPPADYPWYYLLFPLLAAINAAGIAIFLKAFSQRITNFHNMSYFFSFSAFYVGLACTLTPVGTVDLSLKDFVAIVIVVWAAVGFQFFLSLASRYESRASYIALLQSFQMPMTYALDILILGAKVETLNVVGTVLVMTTIILISFSKEQTAATETVVVAKPIDKLSTP